MSGGLDYLVEGYRELHSSERHLHPCEGDGRPGRVSYDARNLDESPDRVAHQAEEPLQRE